MSNLDLNMVIWFNKVVNTDTNYIYDVVDTDYANNVYRRMVLNKWDKIVHIRIVNTQIITFASARYGSV